MVRQWLKMEVTVKGPDGRPSVVATSRIMMNDGQQALKCAAWMMKHVYNPTFDHLTGYNATFCVEPTAFTIRAPVHIQSKEE